MVHPAKGPGQKGFMVFNEDGCIITSNGDLASSESTAQQMMNMLSHALPANFNSTSGESEEDGQGQEGVNGFSNGQQVNKQSVNGVNGGPAGDSQGGQVWKWNRLTVDFGDHSYITCLSNRRVHVIKRDHNLMTMTEADQQTNGQQ